MNESTTDIVNSIVRPLYIELLTCLRDQQNGSMTLLLIEPVILVQDESPTENEITGLDDTIATEEILVEEKTNQVIETDSPSVNLSDKASKQEEIACLRDLLNTYANSDDDDDEQYRWHQVLLSALSVTYGPDHDLTIEATLALIHWLRVHYLRSSQPSSAVIIAVDKEKIDPSVMNTAITKEDEEIQLVPAIPNADGITELYQNCINSTIRRVGSDDDHTLQIQTQLANWYESLQRWDETESLLQELHTVTKRMYGDDSDRVKLSSETMSAFYLRSGRPDPATLSKTNKKKVAAKKTT
jgi:hypothetical protein